jgi:hypothetical protein
LFDESSGLAQFTQENPDFGGAAAGTSTREPHLTQNLATAGSSQAQLGQNIGDQSPLKDVRSVILDSSSQKRYRYLTFQWLSV